MAEWELRHARDGSSNGRALRWVENGEPVEILVDYFPATRDGGCEVVCLVLTHCHEDHRRGVEEALLRWPGTTLYCTALTRALLLARVPALVGVAERIVVLPTNPAADGGGDDDDGGGGRCGDEERDEPESLRVLVGGGACAAERYATLTAYDAGHCAGSAAIRVEACFGVALFTGDFRWDDLPLPAWHVPHAPTPRPAPPGQPPMPRALAEALARAARPACRCSGCRGGERVPAACALVRRLPSGLLRAHAPPATPPSLGSPASPPADAECLALLGAAPLDVLVLDTTCATLPFDALALPPRPLALARAAEYALEHSRRTGGCQRVWVDVSTLGQEPLLCAIAHALDPGRARVIVAPRPSDVACGKCAARLRELWDLSAAEAEARAAGRPCNLPVQLLTVEQARRAGASVATHAWLRMDEMAPSRWVEREALPGGGVLPAEADLMLCGSVLWWALEADDSGARREACRAGRPFEERAPRGGLVVRIPFSAHAPGAAVRALARALQPVRLEPLVPEGKEQQAVVGGEAKARRQLCERLGRSAADARLDAGASVGGAPAPLGGAPGAQRRIAAGARRGGAACEGRLKLGEAALAQPHEPQPLRPQPQPQLQAPQPVEPEPRKGGRPQPQPRAAARVAAVVSPHRQSVLLRMVGIRGSIRVDGPAAARAMEAARAEERARARARGAGGEAGEEEGASDTAPGSDLSYLRAPVALRMRSYASCPKRARPADEPTAGSRARAGESDAKIESKSCPN